MKRITFALIIGFLLLSTGVARANTVRAGVTPEMAPGYVEVGQPFTVDIYMNNTDGMILGYSMPLAFYSPDGSIATVTHRDVGGFGPFNSISMEPDFLSIWNVLNEWTGINFDGSLADTINHTPVSMLGWSEGLGEQLAFQFALQIDETGIFCVDSVSVPNQTPPGKYDWLFDYPTTFNGPYCWEVSEPIPDTNTVRAEASPEIAPGVVEIGQPFTVDIYMDNKLGTVLGYSMPLAFYSPDGSIATVTHRDVGGFGPFNSISMEPDFLSIWNVLNEWTGISFDGGLADTINHTPVSMLGWSEGLGEQLAFQFALQIDENGIFCIDSVSVPNQTPPGKYDWLFDYPTTFKGPYCWAVAANSDSDNDGWLDYEDNCPDVYNPDQSDADGDGLGDVCDECPDDPDNDADSDGVCGDVDNCPAEYNPDQNDADGDGIGDVCDECPDDPDNDADSDGVCGDVDNCPAEYNPDQNDADGDGMGDVCDECPDDPDNDADGDGVCGDVDNCPAEYNPDQNDADGDGMGDVCDECPDDPDNDADGDGVCGDVDNCPAEYNPDQNDADEDGVGDLCDNCPDTYNPDQADADGNGIGDACEIINRTWYVTADGGGDAPTIQAAIDSCIDNDTVMVADGIFTGDGNRDISFYGKVIVVRSENGSESCVIDCQGSDKAPHRGFIFDSGENILSILDGFTVMNGYAEKGGGMFITSSSPTIENCVLKDNYSTQQGGAVYGVDIASAGFESCVFINNTCPVGSAVALMGASLSFDNSTFAMNAGGALGGTVFLLDSSMPVFDNCLIAFNEGYAFVCDDGTPPGGGDPELNCSNIYGNTAGDWSDCVADQASINNNFSADPMFCDTAAGDLHIDFVSPCSPTFSPCNELVGALDVGCGVQPTSIDPDIMYILYAQLISPDVATVYLSTTEPGYTVNDIDLNRVRINDVIAPFDYEIQSMGEGAGDILKMNCLLKEFVECYIPQWDTTMQQYTLSWVFTDSSEASAIGSFKLIGHRSGDVNLDGDVNSQDIAYLLRYMYYQGPAPRPVPEAGDVNSSGTINLHDVIYLVNYLYRGGPPPTGPLMER